MRNENQTNREMKTKSQTVGQVRREIDKIYLNQFKCRNNKAISIKGNSYLAKIKFKI